MTAGAAELSWLKVLSAAPPSLLSSTTFSALDFDRPCSSFWECVNVDGGKKLPRCPVRLYLNKCDRCFPQNRGRETRFHSVARHISRFKVILCHFWRALFILQFCYRKWQDFKVRSFVLCRVIRTLLKPEAQCNSMYSIFIIDSLLCFNAPLSSVDSRTIELT